MNLGTVLNETLIFVAVPGGGRREVYAGILKCVAPPLPPSLDRDRQLRSVAIGNIVRPLPRS